MDLADAGTADVARSRALLAGQNQALQLAVAGAPLASVLDVLVATAERQSEAGVLASVLLPDEQGESLARQHGLPAWSTPIRSTVGEVLGTFALYYRAPREPTEHDRQVVELLAGTAAVVIERDRESRERSRIEQSLRSGQERFRALAKASQALHGSLSVEDVASVLAERARTILGAREATVSLSGAGGPAAIQVPCAGLSAQLIGHQGAKLGIVQVAGKLAGDFGAEDEAVLEQLAAMAAASIENARRYESVRDANQRKDEFLAMLAHELRNPLAPIGNAIALLRKGGAQAREKVIGIMERQLRQMVHLVDDLLDVSRVTTGKIVLKREPVEVREIVQVALEASLPLMQSAGHAFHLDLPPEPLHVVGDATRLAQVLTNLLNNAAKYTPDGGRITLSVRPTRRDVLLLVRDTGLGIPADMLPRVFEAFTQVKHAQERSQGGLGLGLALVMKLVEMHGGDVWAESPGLGEGSTFTVRLPLAQVPVQDGAEAAACPEPAAGAFRILVVDDNQDAAESLAMLLQLSNHDTATAYSGPEAIEMARRTRPRAVFLDIGLPGMSGYDVAKAMREDPDLAGITLVALTGWGTETDQQQALQAGFDYHLTKPAAPDQVQELLARMVQRPA